MNDAAGIRLDWLNDVIDNFIGSYIRKRKQRKKHAAVLAIEAGESVSGDTSSVADTDDDVENKNNEVDLVVLDSDVLIGLIEHNNNNLDSDDRDVYYHTSKSEEEDDDS